MFLIIIVFVSFLIHTCGPEGLHAWQSERVRNSGFSRPVSQGDWQLPAACSPGPLRAAQGGRGRGQGRKTAAPPRGGELPGRSLSSTGRGGQRPVSSPPQADWTGSKPSLSLAQGLSRVGITASDGGLDVTYLCASDIWACSQWHRSAAVFPLPPPWPAPSLLLF